MKNPRAFPTIMWAIVEKRNIVMCVPTRRQARGRLLGALKRRYSIMRVRVAPLTEK